ncbi:glutaminase A [Rhodococcus opacus]|uniref:Glutaminase n=2 Tax=Rhodococcus opacus TaxID=37919 RepID=A0AAX3YQJ3_RHOOP|nr:MULTISPECIES: glutaminase A [Rhodococcus]ELB86862.1 glutaminase [Rhodococcus wratislaviensis IFP 2016]EID80925.1 glutaminase [Rhodococcus opacus RKJ300 = JCM 13270]MBA8960692.1 glutaminase [Rhodococcus opacus]MBP2206257.1 glutaminase [Rhodococcus opacus]MCZ4587267.1 glutaminase A [Rhodococcus opacus]
MSTVVDALIGKVFAATRENRSGELADYIPELAAVAPDSFGICIATVDGFVYEVGDTRLPFTIQSISKPFTYALALADRGSGAVAEKIDVEPSGEPFNEISLDPRTERPRNPMINAGAITAASLVAGPDLDTRFERIRAAYSRYAGRDLTFNRSVYESESRTGHRNRAIGHMLRSFDIITGDPDEAVDLYFRQCSVDVTCRDLSVMAATMANNGVNPVTRETVLDPALVERVLSVMSTCGMYDAAGKWVYEVGLPAKSGVGGGIIAVLPGQIGIAVYSPRLDEHGNSVRGVEACRALSAELELHFLHVTRAARSAIRASYSVVDGPSRMRRTPAERAALDDVGKRSRIYELHGDLLFAGAESAVREIGGVETELEVVVIDVRRVDDVGGIARRMLDSLRDELTRRGCAVALVDPAGLLGYTRSDLTGTSGRVFADLDAALQWSEDTLLDLHCAALRQPASIDVTQHPVLAGLPPEQLRRLARDLDIRTFTRDEQIIHRGDRACGLFLILSGRVSMRVTDSGGAVYRIMTLSTGMTFGEMTMLLDLHFLNDVCADSDVTVAVLPAERYADMAAHEPGLKLALLERLAAGAYEQLDVVLRSLLRP